MWVRGRKSKQAFGDALTGASKSSLSLSRVIISKISCCSFSSTLRIGSERDISYLNESTKTDLYAPLVLCASSSKLKSGKCGISKSRSSQGALPLLVSTGSEMVMGFGIDLSDPAILDILSFRQSRASRRFHASSLASWSWSGNTTLIAGFGRVMDAILISFL